MGRSDLSAQYRTCPPARPAAVRSWFSRCQVRSARQAEARVNRRPPEGVNLHNAGSSRRKTSRAASLNRGRPTDEEPAMYMAPSLTRAAGIAGAPLALAILAGASLAESETSSRQGTLRICADPNNMPFSSENEGGFENKLAKLIGAAL